MIALTAARMFTPLERIEQPLLLLDDGAFAQVSSRAHGEIPKGCRLVDFGDATLAPAFIDIHIHGGAGHDVMESDPKALPTLERFLSQHGVGGYFPTTVTAPVDDTLAALERLADAIEAAHTRGSDSEGRAQPLGIHMEGPFLSYIRRGVHPPENLLAPTLPMFERFWQAARGHIRLMTVAAELEGVRDVIAEATRRGVCVSIGHSDADLNTTRAALAAGARHATHTFNAMRPLGHREPGVLGAVLTDKNVTADIIADGMHVDPVIVQLFLQAKGPERAVFITDATAAAGMPDGLYRIGTLDMEVKHGQCLARGILAGSVLTLDRAVRNVMQFAQWDLQRALRPVTLNPAQVAGVPNRGVIKVGAPADLVVLSPRGEVMNTIIRGAVSEAASVTLGAQNG
jgi:N-acetylglucosamine-6-phosphate deacetylase